MKITRSTTNAFTVYQHNDVQLETYPAKSGGPKDHRGKNLPDLMIYDEDLGYFCTEISRPRARTLLKRMRKNP